MKHTEEEVQGIIKEWEESGMTKKAFCQNRNISYATFHYWCKHFSQRQHHGFTEVSLQDAAGSSSCEIIFPSGVRLVVKGKPSAHWLREVLR